MRVLPLGQQRVADAEPLGRLRDREQERGRRLASIPRNTSSAPRRCPARSPSTTASSSVPAKSAATVGASRAAEVEPRPRLARRPADDPAVDERRPPSSTIARHLERRRRRDRVRVAVEPAEAGRGARRRRAPRAAGRSRGRRRSARAARGSDASCRPASRARSAVVGAPPLGRPPARRASSGPDGGAHLARVEDADGGHGAVLARASDRAAKRLLKPVRSTIHVRHTSLARSVRFALQHRKVP